MIKIKFLWIPSHKGIKGNSTADSLARVGGILKVLYNCQVDQSELFSIKKKSTFKKRDFLQSGKKSFKKWAHNIEKYR